ncbi:7TM-DISM domain-containing protein, partial [uncultured Cytophaga sp.]|uniref:7TMR-DISM family protein n=1 Tax=uncultured Cytophaga sp. TaxID=160238 RepID=UPI0026030BD0
MLVSIFLFSICTHSFSKPATIILNDQKQEYFVVRKYAEYYEDKEKNKKIEDIISNVPFEIISDNKIDFTNKNINSAYWLHFYVLNNTTDLTDFIIEMYDYDINEINIYTKTKNGTFSERKSGLDLPFQTRDFEHKNICFKLPITLKDTTEVYMRLYSTTLNVFEPVIKTQEYFYAYSLKEYVLLGVFYGFMALIILYNFISFLILRIRYYIYYVIYTIGISIYLMSKNGTGFQYLWPNNPNLNVHIDTLSIAVSIIFLSFFTMEFLQI